jgi:hypothetical protein
LNKKGRVSLIFSERAFSLCVIARSRGARSDH